MDKTNKSDDYRNNQRDGTYNSRTHRGDVEPRPELQATIHRESFLMWGAQPKRLR
jgi:hypothetical protein